MTTEIAVFNSEAVVLATDSAVSSRLGGYEKISTYANKLFALSLHCPIGVMVHGNASFMGIPWETIVKVYRSKALRAKKFDTLEEYAEDFISFLRIENIKCHETSEEQYIFAFVEALFSGIVDKILGRIQVLFMQGNEPDEDVVRSIIQEVILENYRENQSRRTRLLPVRDVRIIMNKYRTGINSLMDSMLGRFNLDSQQKLILKRTLLHAYAKSFSDNVYSGVVFAGFGEKEFLPTVKSYNIEGIVCYQKDNVEKEFLKYQYDEERSSDNDTKTAVIAFAQADMVQQFMNGVDTNYRYAEEGFLTGIYEEYTGRIVDQLDRYNDAEKESIKTQLLQYRHSLIYQFVNYMNEFIEEYFSSPVIDAVARLPKNELAAMAEALVYLTSLKRKISQEPETVAEPVDVAIISKGDGFVWVKRKHYFKPELNTLYFLKHFKEISDGTE